MRSATASSVSALPWRSTAAAALAMDLADRRRRDDIADAQSGQQQLGHRADIDHPSRRIARHGEQRLALEMEFMIVIVFQDREFEFRGEVQQTQPPLRRQRNGRRELMVRRHIEGAHGMSSAQALDILDIDAVRVEAGADHLGAGGGEGFARRRIAEPLDQHGVARRDENARGEENPHLAAARDADILGVDDEAAMRGQHRGDGATQLAVPARIAIAEPAGARRAPPRVAIGAQQRVHREEARVRKPVVDGETFPRQHEGGVRRRAERKAGRARIGGGLAPRRQRLGQLGGERRFRACHGS